MYFVIIEPVCSQGVGNYILLTNKKENVNKLRRELEKFKNYLKNINEELNEWEFYEYVYWVTKTTSTKNKTKYMGFLIVFKYYQGDYDYLESTYSTDDINKRIETIYENNDKFELDYVYDFISSKPPCHINKFNILSH